MDGLRHNRRIYNGGGVREVMVEEGERKDRRRVEGGGEGKRGRIWVDKGGHKKIMIMTEGGKKGNRRRRCMVEDG